MRAAKKEEIRTAVAPTSFSDFGEGVVMLGAGEIYNSLQSSIDEFSSPNRADCKKEDSPFSRG